MDTQIGSSAASNNPGFFRFISIPLRWLILCLICCFSIFSTYSLHHICLLANRVGGDFAPPKRPNVGSLGRAIALRTNFFQVRLPKGDIHHYDLSISPDKCPRRVNRDVVEAMVSTYHRVFGGQRPVFDGRKNLYSSKALPIGRKPVSGYSSRVFVISQYSWRLNLFMIEHDRQELTYTIYNVLFILVALCETYDHEGDDQEDRLVINGCSISYTGRCEIHWLTTDSHAHLATE